ncbi:hypothetical protein AVEN_111237-1 [Araneus ventricosus]|uniref:Uncharacterized protein n=1 Tax=Araneus ventricosus TaxID=182803 RepID=A0A4Y2EM40_ARAVE|nr:hypothetical protein AVEN_111237-1 [Araneus ventricosus]
MRELRRTRTLSSLEVCKAFPVIKKPTNRQPGRSYAQATAEKTVKRIQKTERKDEEKSNLMPDLSDIKESLQSIREIPGMKRNHTASHPHQAEEVLTMDGSDDPNIQADIILQVRSVGDIPSGSRIKAH